MERFRIQTFDAATRLIVRISGEVDLNSAQALTDALSLALSVERPITVDCSRITFVDSTALSVLAEARDLAEKCRVRFQLVGVPQPLRRVLELSGAAGQFDIADPRLYLSDTTLRMFEPEYEAVAA